MQHSQAERQDGIVRAQFGSINKGNCDTIFGVLDRLDRGVEKEVFFGEELSRFALDEVGETALIDGEQVIF